MLHPRLTKSRHPDGRLADLRDLGAERRVIPPRDPSSLALVEKNQQVAHLGDNPDKKHWANYNVPPADWKPGIFTAPHGVSFDHEGNVYVMDWNSSGRVSKFKHVEGEKKQAAAERGPGSVALR